MENDLKSHFQLSRTSFPLCMRLEHEALKQNHALKYGARQKYGLFLKAAGLGVDQALAFFRQQYAIDGDKVGWLS